LFFFLVVGVYREQELSKKLQIGAQLPYVERLTLLIVGENHNGAELAENQQSGVQSDHEQGVKMSA
jgi:hypothetical protein